MHKVKTSLVVYLHETKGGFQWRTKAISHSLGANLECFREEAKFYEDKHGGKEGSKDKIRWCIVAGIMMALWV